MAYKIEGRHSVVCENENSLFNYFAWPSVGRLPDGTLAMVSSGFRVAHVCPFGKSVICYSRDEGKTWTRPAVVIDTPLDERDSGIVHFGGKVMVTSFNNRVAFQRETNETRENPQKKALIDAYLDCVDAKSAEEKFLGSLYCISRDGGYTFEEPKISPVTSIHGPCVCRNGEVFYIGRSFLGDTWQDRLACYRLDENESFVYHSSIEDIADDNGVLLSCEPHAVELDNGDILLHIRAQRTGNDSLGGPQKNRRFATYQSKSTDGAKTWSKPRQVGLEGGAPSHLCLHSSGVLIASFGYRKVPFGQRVMFSRDGGESWSEDYILRGDGPSPDLGYPCTVELRDGALLTVYYQQKPGRANCVIMQSIWRLPENI